MTRKITDEEKHLWKTATRGVKGEGSLEARIEDFVPANVKVKITGDIKLPTPVKQLPPQRTSLITRMIEKDNLRKLTTGKTNLDGRLDLHGMWLNEAQRAVVNFVLEARESGKRRLLIITGKGGIDGGGKIRAELPLWLQDGRIAGLISGFSESGPRHGGSGAFYVYLRKVK